MLQFEVGCSGLGTACLAVIARIRPLGQGCTLQCDDAITISDLDTSAAATELEKNDDVIITAFDMRYFF